MMATKRIKLYSLSTCAYCQAIKKMLRDLDVPHEFVDGDLLEGQERDALLAELRLLNPSCSFPTINIDGQTITGFKVQEIKEAIGVRTKVDDLHDMLKKVQEPKGYFFNRDRERTFDLLRGLLTNKDRYGYMACPCRLASGKRGLTETSSAPVSIGRRMSRNSVLVTVSFMCLRSGTMSAFLIFLCRREGPSGGTPETSVSSTPWWRLFV